MFVGLRTCVSAFVHGYVCASVSECACVRVCASVYVHSFVCVFVFSSSCV